MIRVRYAIVTPVRNEAEYLRLTIDSVLAQTIPPVCWIMVNDGSTDNTRAIIDEAARAHSWIKAVHRPDRGSRQAGSGVMEAFYDGYALLAPDWDYLVKLDGDLSFAPDYFQQCFAHFSAEPRLGIGGGTVCTRVDGALHVESRIDPRFHVRGATKIYRRPCWDQVGGLIKAPGWDTVDELKANMLGWTTRTFSDIQLVHHRPAGDAYGTWSNWTKNGRANYVAGYHPLFMFLKCLRRVFEKPYGIAATGLLLGFIGAWMKRAPQIDDRQLIRYFRRQQINRLFGKKSLWDPA
jgi:glycosyltransferase involved in cell wall biosynthesis